MSNEKSKENFKEKCETSDEENKKYGIGIRHLQMFCMSFTMVFLIISRASMAIAVLAMSDDGPHNETVANCSTYSNVTYNDSVIGNHSNLTELNGLNDTGIDIYESLSNTSIECNYNISAVETHIGDLNDMINGTGIVTYKWDKKTQSLILASFFWGYVWMQIPGGILAKKFGGKPLLLVALISNAVICCLVPTFAAVGGWMLVCACRISMGLTQACLFPSTHTLLGQWLPDSERTSYVGVVYGGIQLGTIIAMPLCGFLADTVLGWKLIFYVNAGLMFAWSVIWFFCSANTPREHPMISKEEREFIEAGLNVSDKRPPTPWKQILTSKPVWATLAPHLGSGVSFILFFVDMPTYLEKALQISLRDSAVLSALPYVGMWVGSIFSSMFSEWLLNKKLINITISRKIFQSISQFGLAVGLTILSFLGPENKLLAVITLVGTLTVAGFSTAGFIINQLDLSPNYAGVIISLCNFGTNLVTVVVPIAISYILQNDSTNISRWRLVFLLVAGISLITNIIYLVFGTCKRQDWDDPNYLNKLQSNPEETVPVLEKAESEKKVNETNEPPNFENSK